MSYHAHQNRNNSSITKPKDQHRRRSSSIINTVNTQRSNEGLKYVPSVEEYFAKGMADYARELAAAAARQAMLDAVKNVEEARKSARYTLKKEPSWGNLGDALDRQIVYLSLVSRATQTDWKWYAMAKTWGHARQIQKTLPPRPLPKTTIEHEHKPFAMARARSNMYGPDESMFGSMHSSLHISKSRFKRQKSTNRLNRDKGVDTHDLEFDPYDKKMAYTPIFIGTGGILRYLRLVRIAKKWRKKTQERIHSRHLEEEKAKSTAKKRASSSLKHRLSNLLERHSDSSTLYEDGIERGGERRSTMSLKQVINAKLRGTSLVGSSGRHTSLSLKELLLKVTEEKSERRSVETAGRSSVEQRKDTARSDGDEESSVGADERSNATHRTKSNSTQSGIE